MGLWDTQLRDEKGRDSFDSRLPVGDITAIASELSLLSKLFRLRPRSVRTIRSDERNAVDCEPNHSLSPVSAGRLRPSSLKWISAFF